MKIFKLSTIIIFLFLCSCQSRTLKDAGFSKEKIVKDKDNNYFKIKPYLGNAFLIEPIDIDDFKEF